MEYGAVRRRRALRRLCDDAFAQGVLTPNEWLDLGGLSSLLLKSTLVPAFGSSTRVSIPHQSGTENTAAGSLFLGIPEPTLLAKDIKQRLHDGEIVSFGPIHTA